MATVIRKRWRRHLNDCNPVHSFDSVFRLSSKTHACAVSTWGTSLLQRNTTGESVSSGVCMPFRVTLQKGQRTHLKPFASSSKAGRLTWYQRNSPQPTPQAGLRNLDNQCGTGIHPINPHTTTTRKLLPYFPALYFIFIASPLESFVSLHHLPALPRFL